MERVILDAAPDMGALLAQSFGQWGVRKVTRQRPERLPDRVVELSVTQDANRLARYDRVCGFTVRDLVPATWIHVLAFPLQLVLLSAPDSPFSLAGIVHATNSMTLYRPVSVGENLRMSCSYGPAREHRRGVIMDMIGEAHVGDELVWRGVSAYLVRDESLPGMIPLPNPTTQSPESTTQSPEPVEGSDLVTLPTDVNVAADAIWRLPANLGRQYAQVSGDMNPIHMHPLGGKAFGFPRAIIHGMWTHAKVLAALEPRLTDAYRMDVRFTKPILLPSTVRFGAVRDADTDAWTAVVRPRSGEKSHLVARVTPA